MEFKPHAYQAHCIEKILEINKIGLFLDMGLGKTVTTLTAVKELKYNRFLVRKVLVIEESGRRNLDKRKRQMGAYKDASGIPGFGEPDKTDPGTEYTGRHLYHQSGKRMLAGGLLQTGMAV